MCNVHIHLSLPRSTDKLAVSLAFYLQLVRELELAHMSPAGPLCNVTLVLVAACLAASLVSTFAVAASSRYSSSLALISFTQVLTSCLPPNDFCIGVPISRLLTMG